MKNSDEIRYIGITTGGVTGGGKTLGTKIRFTGRKPQYTKILDKMGAMSLAFYPLAEPMTKVEALKVLIEMVKEGVDPILALPEVVDAINHTTKRLLGKPAIMA